MQERKILALCSGGFDSILMLHTIRERFENEDIKVMFFNYGQKNLEAERECTFDITAKLNLGMIEIKLPRFFWTKGDFYSEEFSGDKEYLEMRNMIFLSYALSYCEGNDIDTVYMATLKSLGYYDTSVEFLDNIRNIYKAKGIELLTPFSEYVKEELDLLAFKYSIKPGDFFSCDNPTKDLKPCGECPDCITLSHIMEHAELNTPIKNWLKNSDPNNAEFQQLVKDSPITEMRVLLNNDCQLNCSHCYYGFDEMVSERLSKEELTEVFKQARDLGINEYHFSGKEPLYDVDYILEVTKLIKEINPNADFTVVTNGINVPEFTYKMYGHKFSKVFLSVDDLENIGMPIGLRGVNNVTEKALKELKKYNIPVEIFIDLHENNYDKVDKIIKYLYNEYGCKDFYVRTLSLVGKSLNAKPLSSEQLGVAYDSLYRVSKMIPEINNINLTLMSPYVYNLLDNEEEWSNIITYQLYQAVTSVMTYANRFITPNLSIFPQLYCGKYESQITLTPDGYIHGCASEVSIPEYDKIASGNVRDHSLDELIKRGKNLCIKSNCNEVDENGNLKYFSCTVCKAIDIVE